MKDVPLSRLMVEATSVPFVSPAVTKSKDVTAVVESLADVDTEAIPMTNEE